MAGAVAPVGIGLITIGLGNFANTPQAIAAAPAVVVEAGPEEATIVAFGAIDVPDGYTGWYRLWSDHRLEVRLVGLNDPFVNFCDSTGDLLWTCNVAGVADSGWLELPPPPGGEGFACRADTNGDRRVDGVDLATVLAQWGNGVSCDPQPSYPCFDLGNLGLTQPGM